MLLQDFSQFASTNTLKASGWPCPTHNPGVGVSSLTDSLDVAWKVADDINLLIDLFILRKLLRIFGKNLPHCSQLYQIFLCLTCAR